MAATIGRSETLRVKGYYEFLRAVDHADKTVKKAVRDELRAAALPVRLEAQHEEADTLRSAKSAAGLRIIVRRRGVALEQTLRKTTGKRGDWGATQMRDALLPALERHQTDVERRLEQTLGRIVDRFGT